MGLYDSFYDEDSKCPKCNAKMTDYWQTKSLENALASWHKGDLVQYGKLAPVVFNGNIPVHNSCRNCKSWLEAYARVVAGRFKGIMEIELGRKRREMVVMGPETTAESLRREFENRLSHLQESCEHEKTKWTEMKWPLGLIYGRRRVCLKCEKTLETRNEFEPNNPRLKKLLRTSKRLR